MHPHHCNGGQDLRAVVDLQHVLSCQCRRTLGQATVKHHLTLVCWVQNQSAQFVPITPVQREHQRQAQFAGASDFMDDLHAGDDKGFKNVSNQAIIPNGMGSRMGGGFMSYHGGKIVSTPLTVYLIM